MQSAKSLLKLSYPCLDMDIPRKFEAGAYSAVLACHPFYECVDLDFKWQNVFTTFPIMGMTNSRFHGKSTIFI